jgi:predicted transcriptional regulator
MKAFVQLERLKRMNRLIKEEKTGDPEEFAQRLKISPSHLYRCIEDMKELGAPVNFSRSRHTYYYEQDFDIKVSYSVQLLSENKTKKIIGGFSIRNTSLLFLRVDEFKLAHEFSAQNLGRIRKA